MATLPILGQKRAAELAHAFDAARRAAGLAAPTAVITGAYALAPVFGVVGVLFEFLQRRQEAIAKDPPRPDFDRPVSIRLPKIDLNLAPDRWETIEEMYGSGGPAYIEMFIADERWTIGRLAALLRASERHAGALIAGDSKHARDRRAESVAFAGQVQASLSGLSGGFSFMVEMAGDVDENANTNAQSTDLPDGVLADLFRSNVTRPQIERLIASSREPQATFAETENLLLPVLDAFAAWLKDWDGELVLGE